MRYPSMILVVKSQLQNPVSQVVFATLLFLAAWFLWHTDYMTERSVIAVVDSKYSKEDSDHASIRYRIQAENLFVSRPASDAVMQQSKVGDKQVLIMRPFDMRPTPWETGLFFILPTICLSAGISLLLSIACIRFFPLCPNTPR
uniref:Uncharacterized protein n=4 Tax=Pseudomonas TaxID=286 RepID=A0A1V0M6K9_PSEAI|nr:Hypothetical protein [Pseudomonas aeruginosa]QOJ62797.1 Hypothetical protein [Pseudomonas aeruginosa]QOJ63350.1 Hypothetical protein [Pseudomonas aeruginosa]QOJ63904.1 Hypothetical protein [Pseudomonas aeruginosa]QOJ64417.1 Hypothetical protein [Pseudomonas aeruginosa]